MKEIITARVLIICTIMILLAGSAMAQERQADSSQYSGGLILPDLEWWKANMPVYQPDKSPVKGSIDWRNYNGKNYTTPAKNQGYCGSCAAFAGVSLLESLMEIEWDQPDANYNMSEQHLFACAGGTCNGGATQPQILDYMKYQGVPSENCYPYKSGMTGWDYACSNTCNNWQDGAVKIKNYYWVNSITAIKSALMDGPVVAGIQITNGLQDYSGGVFTGYDCGGPEDVNHGVIIVGYDDGGGYWIAKNSWGASYGDNGFFKIKFGVCGIDSWVMKADLGDGTLPDDDDDDSSDDDDDDNADDDDETGDDDDNGENVDQICNDLIGMIYNGCGYYLKIDGKKVASNLAYTLCQDYEGYWSCIAECYSDETVGSCSSLDSCVESLCKIPLGEKKTSSDEDEPDSCGS